MPSRTCAEMKLALQCACKASKCGEVPVGAVIVDARGAVIASAYNHVETLGDITAHAEMLAIREASHVLGTKYLEQCSLYVTLEPCAMCAQAIAYARLQRVYFGAYDPKSGGVEYGATIFKQPTTHHIPEVYGGIMERECADLLQDFFKLKRTN
jgi:tRNA(adenine34) deaminase